MVDIGFNGDPKPKHPSAEPFSAPRGGVKTGDPVLGADFVMQERNLLPAMRVITKQKNGFKRKIIWSTQNQEGWISEMAQLLTLDML